MIYDDYFAVNVIDVRPHEHEYIMRKKPKSRPQPYKPSRKISPLPTPGLLLVCTAIYLEIKDLYHPASMYNFPCLTVFIDIISQWSSAKTARLKRLTLRSTNLRLTRQYHLGLPELLLQLPGLYLDELIIVDGCRCFQTRYGMARYLTDTMWQRHLRLLLENPCWKRLQWNTCCSKSFDRARVVRDMEPLVDALEDLGKMASGGQEPNERRVEIKSIGRHKRRYALVVGKDPVTDGYQILATAQSACASDEGPESLLKKILQKGQWVKVRRLDEFLGGCKTRCGWEKKWLPEHGEQSTHSRTFTKEDYFENDADDEY